jgi:hypothetical protein
MSSSNKHCQSNDKCQQTSTSYCQACGQNFCKDHYNEHEAKVKEHIEYVIHTRDLLAQKSKEFISELSTDDVFNLIPIISEYNLKLDENERRANKIKERFQNTIKDNKTTSNKNVNLENDIEQLKKDIENLDLELDDLRNAKQQQLPGEEGQSSSQNDTESKQEGDLDEDEMIVFLDSNTASKISQKVRFSNNIVRWLRGPFKSAVHGTMRAVDICAQATHISEYILQAVKKGIEKQKQSGQEESNNVLKPAFVEITSEWKIEGENPDRGYSSPSFWIIDPQGQRILIKIQEHPLCAANEWLAYVLGRVMGLPVNEVQIAIYENNLVTLHADVENKDEKTITFMDLPEDKREALMSNPILESMDIFDRIIQNVDRNQQNILITIPKTEDINDENLNKVKVHFIDHASSFGMGKLNAISLIAAKFHSNHFAVVKFDPVVKTKEFEDYLNKIPETDRPLIGKTLNRFASITDEQYDKWITEIQDLLSPNQYNRIYSVLHRQRNIVKRYVTQWGISSTSSDESEQNNSKLSGTINLLK